MRIAIYGGSFNPPHLGHVAAAKSAQAALGADRLLVIPAGNPPHKALAPGSPDAAERLALTHLTFDGVPGVQVSDLEVGKAPSYSVETLETLRRQYPDAELVLLMGTDMLLSFEQWKSFRRILEIAELGVFIRNSGEEEKVYNFAAFLCDTYGGWVNYIAHTPLPLSSTQLREQLPKRQGRASLAEGAYGEIIRKRLYAAQPDLDWLREKSEPYLDKKRVPHVRGCAAEAARLARRWGADADLAQEAGILHDITKKFTRDEQLLFCEKYGIITDAVERENPKLLHAKTGAALSRDLFGVSDEVYGAIFWHTTGRPNMRLLEKILYMADYIEPNRQFEGVDALRALAYADLDKAMVLGLKMSLEDISSHGTQPHQNSIEALSWYQRQGMR